MDIQTPWSGSVDARTISQVVDPHVDRALDSGIAPGIAYGVVVGDELVHHRAVGMSRTEEGQNGDSADLGLGNHVAFRIASMTKSFTAATLLSLRDAGLLSMQTPVADLVPEIAPRTHPQNREISIEQLATMGSGFLTDDPWGDRQQDLAIDSFRDLLRRGVPAVLPPGDRFEYSNLGYAVLGLVISAVSGQPYEETVRERVLEPLGLHETAFDVATVGVPVATGYVRRSTGWVAEPIAGSGAFSPMGGLLSTVNDLSSWVCFLQAERALGDLRPASLREMQRTRRLAGATTPRAGGLPPTVTGYGYGLFEEFTPWGRTVFHSGGYPGFGSHMRWHAASGLGVIALGNSTYAPVSAVARAMLQALVEQLSAPTTRPHPEIAGLAAAAAAVREWLSADDLDGPEGHHLRALWADNVERDLPWPERVTEWQQLRQEHGPYQEVEGSEHRPSPGAVRWEMAPQRPPVDGAGRVSITVMVAPHDPALVQSVAVRRIPRGDPQDPPLSLPPGQVPAVLTADLS